MSLFLLVLAPLAGAALLALTRGALIRMAHAVVTLVTLGSAAFVVMGVAATGSVTALGGHLRADGLSAWMIGLVALVTGLAAVEAPRQVSPADARRFYPLFHLFVATMLLAIGTDDVGLMWVAVEGTTLASVFLVNLERSRASLEAAYKYLLICSVGVAIAFVGTVLVYFADAQRFGHEAHALRWTTLVRLAPGLPAPVMELAFVFLLIGYGTKAGLAPMHTWLPDAHSEAPAPVSALMSGVLLSVGVYAILRFKTVVDLASGPEFTRRLLVVLGLASMAVAAAFLWAPANYKRMLAYSSIEHIGVVCLGLGFGGAWGVAGALLHVANHALSKSVLFLLSGRIRAAFGSADVSAVTGLLAAMPVTGRGFLLAMLALMGLPPFGLFLSEVLIFGAGFQTGHAVAAVVGLGLLVVAFAGLLRTAHGMLYGPPAAASVADRSGWLRSLPMGLALLLLTVTGVAWPPGLAAALDHIARLLGP
jgi:hydrogenase-4 component F